MLKLLFSLLLSSFVLQLHTQTIPISKFLNGSFNCSPFTFQVYCPTPNLPTVLGTQIYNIFVQALPTNASNPNSQTGLFYCGLARQWKEPDCSKAKMVCSSPGPMFRFAVGQEATIIWVNAIDNSKLNWPTLDCYDPLSSDTTCSINSKTSNWDSCTYFDPTNYFYNTTKKIRVSKNNVPISPHIHGLQIRPIYDGNPLSWFDNKGNKGTGFSSWQKVLVLENVLNYGIYIPPISFGSGLFSNIKIIKVKNNQLPGILFYHDHAMKSTKYNVQMGLSGFYIIYNKTIEKDLPLGSEEKYFVFSQNNQIDIRINTNHQQVLTLNPNDVFFRNLTYRFRFLNGHFDSLYLNVSFVAYYSTTIVKGIKVYTEIDPSSISYDLQTNMQILSFTIIGSDSSLFNKPVHSVTQFSFGSAERIDLLIKFDSSQIPANIKNVYLIAYDNNIESFVLKNKFQISSQLGINKYRDPKQVTSLDVPFTNLSLKSDTAITLKRMRSLMNYPFEEKFVINGHYMFEMGSSQNPKIGTIEDWYIINSLPEAHPIHIHLVNFQIYDRYRLKMLPQGCSYYDIDFFKQSKLPQFQESNYTKICLYLKSLNSTAATSLYHRLNSYSSQNSSINTSKGKISGLNVLQKLAGSSSEYIYLINDCPLGSQYKYVCENTKSQIFEHEKRWKDTALIAAQNVFVLRVRWTKTSFDETKQTYPYFNEPEDDLIEFPGFVYHCHLLPHEDNQMMRPIMLQHSDIYLSSLSINATKNCQGKTWLQSMLCINQRLKCVP